MKIHDPIERAMHDLPPFDFAKWEHRPSGTIIVDEVEVAHTLMCPHCNSHFISTSHTVHDYCCNCAALTCGQQKCLRCVPFERRLELYEQGKIGRLMDEP